MIRLVPLVVPVLLGSVPAPAQEFERFEALPEGPGLAAKFVNDAGIATHPHVLFHDDFEAAGEVRDLERKWDGGVHHQQHVRISTEPGLVHSGRRGVEFTCPKGDNELANAAGKQLKEERDVLFLRYYSKYSKDFSQVGSSHNGASISAHYMKDGRATPGQPADGTNKFLCAFESWRGEEKTVSPGHMNIYCYHPGQATGFGDHFFPSGKVLPNSSARSGTKTFGKLFRDRPDFLPQLDRWYCFEFMVKANTVGRRDGRVAFWVDGKLMADFPGLRFRDVETLKIDHFKIGLHVGHRTRDNQKWYDDVVAATSYIGPMRRKKP